MEALRRSRACWWGKSAREPRRRSFASILASRKHVVRTKGFDQALQGGGCPAVGRGVGGMLAVWKKSAACGRVWRGVARLGGLGGP